MKIKIKVRDEFYTVLRILVSNTKSGRLYSFSISHKASISGRLRNGCSIATNTNVWIPMCETIPITNTVSPKLFKTTVCLWQLVVTFMLLPLVLIDLIVDNNSLLLLTVLSQTHTYSVLLCLSKLLQVAWTNRKWKLANSCCCNFC